MFDRAPVSSCFSKSWDFNSRSSRLSLAMKPKSTFACYEIKVDSRLLWTTTTLYSLLYKLNVDSRLLWSQSRLLLVMKSKLTLACYEQQQQQHFIHSCTSLMSTLACYEAKVDPRLLWSQSRPSLAMKPKSTLTCYEAKVDSRLLSTGDAWYNLCIINDSIPWLNMFHSVVCFTPIGSRRSKIFLKFGEELGMFTNLARQVR